MTLEELQKMKELQALKDDNSTIARAGVGLSSILTGIGASPDVALKSFQNADSYLKNTEPAPIKELKTVDVGGKPVFLTPSEAHGQQAYEKPTSTKGGGGFALKEVKNIKTGQKVVIKDKGNGYYDLADNPIMLDQDWVFSHNPKTATHGTATGGKVTFSVDTDTNKVSPIIKTVGIGDVVGTSTKEEAQSRVSSAKKGKDVAIKHQQNIDDAESAEKVVSSTNDPMVFATTVGNVMRTAVGEKRLSDDEARNFMGDEYKSYMTQAGEYASRKFAGGIPPEVRNNALRLVRAAKERAKQNLKSTVKTYGNTAGLSEAGKKAVQQTIGTQNQDSGQSRKSTLLNKLQGI